VATAVGGDRALAATLLRAAATLGRDLTTPREIPAGRTGTRLLPNAM
jgi:hypothetical protein